MPTERFPSVAVIITYYKEGDLILRALKSLWAQDYAGPVEVVIVDDCSPIPVPAIESPRFPVKVICTPKNSYAGAARNLGAQSTQAEIICFLDADDTYLPNRLSAHVLALQNNDDVVMVGAPCWTHRENDVWLQIPQAIAQNHPEPLPSALLPKDFRFWIADDFCFGTNCITLRREQFLLMGGFDTIYRWGEEWEFQIRAAQYGRVYYVADPACHYLCRPGSITSTVNPWKFVSMAKIFAKSRQSIDGLPAPHRRRAQAEEQQAWLLATQEFLEVKHDSKNALDCAWKAFRCRRSIWSYRSLLRALLWRVSSVRLRPGRLINQFRLW